MFVPCDTCRDKARCYRFASMNRDALFAAAAGDVVECPEYKEGFDYVTDMAGVQRGRAPGRSGGVCRYGNHAFLGVR